MKLPNASQHLRSRTGVQQHLQLRSNSQSGCYIHKIAGTYMYYRNSIFIT
jgi:hypothetical protein